MYVVDENRMKSEDKELIDSLYDCDYFVPNYDFCIDASSDELIYLKELDKVVFIVDLLDDLVSPAESCSEDFRKFKPTNRGVRRSVKLDFKVSGLSKLVCNYNYPKANNIQRIIKRDDFYCQLCGSSYDLEVHHIIPKSNKILPAEWINNSFNVVTLCKTCHGRVHETFRNGNSNEKMDCLDKLLKLAGNNYSNEDFLGFCKLLGLYTPHKLW
jgi:5-methylcytosine-specific restriction endonuclease McrA